MLLCEEMYFRFFFFFFHFQLSNQVQVIQGVFFFRRLCRQAFFPFSSPPHRPSPPLLPRFSLASKIEPEAIRILNRARINEYSHDTIEVHPQTQK